MVSHKEHGLTVLELIVTVGIAMVMSSITFIALKPMLNGNHIDTAYDTTLMALRNTRNLAITQSHEYYVNFNPTGFPTGTIQIEYQPPAVGGIAPPLQQVQTFTIPTDTQFAVQAGFPTNTPDGFGAGVNAIDFGQGLAGEPLNYVIFMPDGSSQAFVIGSNGTYNSGVVYVTRPGDSFYNSRAVTVWGATGRVRGWRLSQKAGLWTWVQQ
jgi:Tfp pilus assembly protein PilE